MACRAMVRETNGSRRGQRSPGHYPCPAVSECDTGVRGGGRGGDVKKHGDKPDDARGRNGMI